MDLLRVELTNFLSHQESDVRLRDVGTYLLVGRNVVTGNSNGAGKSAICDAISWCLFGKARRDADALIRYGQDAMNVAVTLEHRGKVIRVKRSRSRGKSTRLTAEVLDERDVGSDQAHVDHAPTAQLGSDRG